jgi:hypothetical protein
LVPLSLREWGREKIFWGTPPDPRRPPERGLKGSLIRRSRVRRWTREMRVAAAKVPRKAAGNRPSMARGDSPSYNECVAPALTQWATHFYNETRKILPHAQLEAKERRLTTPKVISRTQGLEPSEYKWGFTIDIESDVAPKGLSEETVRFISEKKGEPDWMLEWRLRAYRLWAKMSREEPRWSNIQHPPIDYQDIIYYAAPLSKAKGPNSLEEVGNGANTTSTMNDTVGNVQLGLNLGVQATDQSVYNFSETTSPRTASPRNSMRSLDSTDSPASLRYER